MEVNNITQSEADGSTVTVIKEHLHHYPMNG